MNHRLFAAFGTTLLALAAAISAPAADSADWKQILTDRLPLYGHRNWIVIADSAYPAQSRSGIETVVSGADHLTVLKTVLDALSSSIHVQPIIYTDKELRFVPESDAPGIGEYRHQLNAVLNGEPTKSLPHEEIISKLDQTGETFRVLIIKTNLAIPYTSVFLQLDCKYWSDDAEHQLRTAMAHNVAH